MLYRKPILIYSEAYTVLQKLPKMSMFFLHFRPNNLITYCKNKGKSHLKFVNLSAMNLCLQTYKKIRQLCFYRLFTTAISQIQKKKMLNLFSMSQVSRSLRMVSAFLLILKLCVSKNFYLNK